MPELEMQRAQAEAELSDLFIVAGSSLVVFPAATIPLYAKEKELSLLLSTMNLRNSIVLPI